MFRFVDVLASLRNSGEIVRHLDEYFATMRNGFAPLLQTGVRAAKVVPWFSSWFLRWNVSGMARQFISGRNPADALKTLRKGRKHRIGFTVDLLGEAVVSEQEAYEYGVRCLELLEGLAAQTRGWTDPLGEDAELFPVVNLSVKISALYSQMNPADPEDAIEHLSSEAAADPAPREGTRRVRQFRHGELRAQELHARSLQSALHRAAFQGLAARRHCHPGISPRRRTRPARPDRMGAEARHALHRAPGERRVLGLRKDQSRTERLALSRLATEAGERCELRGLHARAPGKRRHRHLRVRLAQRPQHRPRAGTRGADGDRQEPVRISTPLRNGRADQARARRDGLPGARILSRGRTASRDGLSR